MASWRDRLATIPGSALMRFSISLKRWRIPSGDMERLLSLNARKLFRIG